MVAESQKNGIKLDDEAEKFFKELGGIDENYHTESVDDILNRQQAGLVEEQEHRDST